MDNPLKILLVDDNVVNLMLLDRLLRNEGAEIFKAVNGEETVELCEEHDFALILLDVQMPGMDGYDTAKAIRRIDSCRLVPIIFLTAIYKDPAYARMGYEAGAVDFLTQPIDPPTLRSKVGIFLQLKRQKDLLEREIAQRIKTEKALRVAKEKYRNIFVRAVEGIFRSTLDGEFVEVNPALARILGFDSPEEALTKGCGYERFAEPDERFRYIEFLKRDKYLNDYEIQIKRKDGTLVWISESSRLFEEDGEFYIEGVVEDVTQRKICELDLQQKATLDALTGVPNRYLFFDRLESSIASARRYGEKLALLFIDLDNFKSVNDRFGHHAGDVLLLNVATRLKSRLRASDTLARLGGDEFCVLLERPSGRDDVQKVAEDLVSCLTDSFNIDGMICNVGASVGISLFPDDAAIAEELVQRADSAMYKVKEGSFKRYCFFSGDECCENIE
ncbi:PAS domain S-box-containing protein/diguanylate cyclase (GGDEF) domain-containing protein [Maridesulfovibrio ferrireducens]|uniref:PAS domain S-box-containing protein/diguanylate cyclase (GGDEF) domain-containing protein n=1 Tax=Maridesulfovibrio ferrireducens TaxID=246191 RepID=A0A1G9EHK7_9BACT|nr:diguanylate cyclase [Maridesulfovibrio ferrireducens]SDK75630.1 PAS domain S-box-containing protein/diguanylate cyclase (GGDEF) domain-containing protein [Maridesulfovibrio ferrireducens]